jgi:two-component system CheB/CheR fusion protein
MLSQSLAAMSMKKPAARKQPPRKTRTRAALVGPDVPAPAGEHPFPIVGIGASAGGLEAFTQLLSGLPGDSGAAFVLVQHLDPKHESILASLLSRATRMPVHETTDGTRIEPDHVYVIPPAVDIALVDGRIRHVPRGTREKPHLPIDLFLRTLAHVQGSRAIAVILSGTGMDGTLGCKAVKAQGGIAFAQEPASAKFDGMPQSAILAGCVDSVLAPAEIGREIVRLARGEYIRESPKEDSEVPVVEGDQLARIFALLKRATGADFTCYKKATLKRRIQRRMALHRIERLADYATFLESQPGEVQDLHQDLLINVTSFFRDPETFRMLSTEIFPRLLHGRTANSPVRVWVPGCATGEEAYSIAMCLLETLSELGSNIPIQIFATDLSDAAIEKARAGVYLDSIAADVSRERLLRFFVRVDGNYQVSRAVRDVLIFARQDLTRDPPFSRMDLVSCRNVLIYLEPSLQQKVMATFHYALLPGGVLVLGQSETSGASSELFTIVHKEQRIYSRRAYGIPRLSGPPDVSGKVAAPRWVPAVPRTARRTDVEREAERVLLSRYAPASVLVDEREEVFHFSGDTEAYLAHAQGVASLQLVKIARKGLRRDLRRLLHEARATNTLQKSEPLVLHHRGQTRRVTLEVIPIQGPGSGERCYLALFDEGVRRRVPGTAVPPRGGSAARRHIAQLEQELQAQKRYQQAVQEEQEAANEELQSANEEIVSSNEELQSLNEEMETAKEELQSNNEELLTLNEELQNRNLELQRVNDDLDNFLASATVPLLMVGPDLMVRRFTPTASDLLGLLPSDVGRPLGSLRMRIEVADLESLVRHVVETLRLIERELQDREGRWWRLYVRPYRTRDHRIDGAVLVLVDIDALKRSQEVLEKARDFAEAIVGTAREPMLILDAELRVRRANRSFYETFDESPARTEGTRLFDLGDRQWDIPGLRSVLDQVLTHDRSFDDIVVQYAFPASGTRTMVLNARKLRQETTEEDLILVAIEDRTEMKRAETERAELLQRAQEAAQAADAANPLKDEFVATASHELRGPLNAIVTWTHLLSAGALDPAGMARGLAAIERSVNAQVRLIEDLLDVTRITLGKLRLEMRLLDLQTVMEAALDNARPAAQAKGVALSLVVDGPECVLGDAGRLQQVVWNLLSNAVKFTPKGGKVEVWGGRVGTNVQVRVSDSGQGIAPSFLPFVFERFRQADASASRLQPGLGLGLAIVRQLVEMHGGTVTAESPGEGQGATFVVSLPVPAVRVSSPVEGEEAEPVVAATPERAPRPSSLRGLRVLVVDDDPDGRDAVLAVLEQAGAVVTTAASAAEALAAIDAAVPEVLVSDIGMPVRDGYDLIRELRKRPREEGGEVPALALTAYASAEDRQKTVAAGFQEHLAKPARPAELVARVAGLAGRVAGG